MGVAATVAMPMLVFMVVRMDRVRLGPDPTPYSAHNQPHPHKGNGCITDGRENLLGGFGHLRPAPPEQQRANANQHNGRDCLCQRCSQSQP